MSTTTPRPGPREVGRRRRDLCRAIGTQVRALREDAGLSQAAVARAAGIDRAHLSRLEQGNTGVSLDVLVSLGGVLGAELGVRLFPGAGPRVRDRFQAPIVEALLRLLGPGWLARPEVPIREPVRGVIDLVLESDDGSTLIACEVQSELRRLEQLIRWSALKAQGLGAARGRADEPSTLLIIRSTVATRDVARQFERTLGAAYPAAAADAYRSLTSDGSAWPGSAILWARVDAGRPTILERPPRGVAIGRDRPVRRSSVRATPP